MGKFLDPREKVIVNKYIDSYLQGTDLYSKYIDSSPTFVTYYSKDVRISTEDPGLGNVVEIIGNESPIKFNKIENFPLFSLDEIQPAIESDEMDGLSTIMESTALILPNTIIPSPDDFLIISYHENNDDNYKRIFRVDNVEMTSISSKTFYKISFSVEDIDINILENRQIQDEYGVVYENIGTEKNSIIIKEDLLLMEEFESIKEKLFLRYKNLFYIEKINSFCYNDGCYFIYNPYLSRFIRNNNLFIEERNFMKNFFIEDVLDRYTLYFNTPYYYLENEDDDSFNFINGFIFLDLNENIFSLYQEKFKELFFFSEEKNKFLECNIKDILNEYENKNSVNNLNNFEKLFILYIKDFKNISNKEFLNLIKGIKVKDDLESYNLVPMIFFIIKKIYERIFIE